MISNDGGPTFVTVEYHVVAWKMRAPSTGNVGKCDPASELAQARLTFVVK